MKRLWLWFPRWLRIAWICLAALVGLIAVLVGGAGWYVNPSVHRTDGIVYGRRNGRDLTLNVIRPSRSNGFGIAVIVSGGHGWPTMLWDIRAFGGWFDEHLRKPDRR